ncbi:unnamed protein product, partial [Iphiclides podalirius]
MEGKKKRSSNYTIMEKDTLLQLIKKYQHIIENKETNAKMISKKRETWDCICNEYNSVALSGFRSWKQLRHLYENLKQRSKKNISKENRLQYNDRVIEVQKKAPIEKKEITGTDVRSYKLIATGHGDLVMAAPHVHPEHNPCDDGAFYFGDSEATTDERPTMTVIHEFSHVNNNENQETQSTSAKAAEDNKFNKTTNGHRTISKNKIKETLIQKYFNSKLRNAKLETKYLINKNKMEINKYKLEMQILKLKHLQASRRIKMSRKNHTLTTQDLESIPEEWEGSEDVLDFSDDDNVPDANYHFQLNNHHDSSDDDS